MPVFSKLSLSKLSTCHPELQLLFTEVIKLRDCQVLEGFRGQAAQDAAYAAGNSKLKWPNGNHNKSPSYAVDVTPYPMPAWSKTADFVYFGGFVTGVAAMLYLAGKMKYRIRYGGDFNRNDRITDSTFLDAVHFELVM